MRNARECIKPLSLISGFCLAAVVDVFGLGNSCSIIAFF
jgi:hypothetical protein